MTDRLTGEQCLAKALVFEECADHLELHWTDDPLEYKMGIVFAKKLHKRAAHWKQLARLRDKEDLTTDATQRVRAD